MDDPRVGLVDDEFITEELENVIIVRKKGKRSDDCIISAHGGQPFVCPKFKVPANVTLVFYQPHGYVLRCRTDTIMQGATSYKEKLPASKCQDYELSCYQDAGSEESISSIKQMGKDQTESYMKYVGIKQKFPNTDVDEYLEKYGTWMDVVAIKEHKVTMLSKVLQELQPLNYQQTHCSFCRIKWSGSAGDRHINAAGERQDW
jgi:hypothetical protein